MMNRGQQARTASSILGSFLLGFLLLGLSGCGSSGNSSDGTPPVSPVGSATITGSVSGTVIKVVDANTSAVLAQTDTASQPGPSRFSFSLSNIPTGKPIKVFFFSAGQTFPLFVGSPSTNVFTIASAGAINLGFVNMSGGTATPSSQPPSGSIQLGSPDPTIPPSIVPPPATLTVPATAQGQGPIDINFTVANFSIGGQGQQHLHVIIDGGSPHHFFNGSTNNVTGGTVVQWRSPTSFRLNGLPAGTYQVEVKLATASEIEYVNSQANPAAITVTIDPPTSQPTVSVTSPLPGTLLPLGPVTVTFSASNFTIGGQGQDHLHIYVDAGAIDGHFYNGSTGSVLDDNGNPVSNITRLSSTSFQITGLSSGTHSVRLVLANSTHQELQNAEDTITFTIQPPQGSATISVTSGPSYLSSPVRISFSVTNFTIGSPGNQHMRFTIDGGPANDFYIGTGNDPDLGVQRNGQHTHFAHWISATQFDLFGLAAGNHLVRLALVDASNNELPNSEAKTTQNFNVQQPPSGELSLQSVLGGLTFPSALAQAPDGRVFFNELFTGNIRVVTTGATWNLDPSPFCSVTLAINLGNEQGLLGLALDPAFSSSNQVLYVYYTASGPSNRVSKLTKQTNGTCTEVPILTGLPTSANHNSGIIKFGPDGMLYIIIGDAESPSSAQDLDSLAGKILRVNPATGAGVSGNPFLGTGGPNRDRVYSLGHRNSFGFTFHPSTGDLWESENGPSDFDEVNRITSGGNYGWNSSQRSGCRNLAPQFIDPIVQFPIFAPTGIVGIPSNSSVYSSAYQGNLLVAGFNDGTIRLVIANPSASCGSGNTSVAFTGGLGFLTSLVLGSDGYVYASGVPSTTNSAIYRVVPQH